jgi:hypothetical protein
MELVIDEILNGDTPNSEYIDLLAKEDVELSKYAILDHTFKRDGKLSDKFRHLYHLPKLKVAKGEYVRIYIGVGTDHDGAFKNQPKTKVHFIFWNSKECVLNNYPKSKDSVELIKYEVVSKMTAGV